MKRRFFLFTVLLCVLGPWLNHGVYGQQASDGQQASETAYAYIPYFRNNPLPKHPASLKILGVGNSFTNDGMQYLPDLLKHAGIENVMLGKLSIGGCSLERHYQLYSSGEAVYHYEKSYPGKNSWETASEKCAFVEAVSDEAWDVIVIQQVSHSSGLYDTYQPYLNQLISAIVTNCPNAGVTLAWQMTWAYNWASEHKGFANYDRNQDKMYQAILQAVWQMASETGIDLIIPSATTIQNLRQTSLNNPPLDLTRDGYHIDLGAGRYALACTWFQTLIAPCFNTTIVGNSCRIADGNIPVTDDNYKLIQKAAQYACSRRFEVSVELKSPTF